MKLNRIKTVLSEKGISQTWLAKQLNKSFSMVNAYACNRIQPNLETLQQIAEILQYLIRLGGSETFCSLLQMYL
jgi:putative transcriptional regulator